MPDETPEKTPEPPRFPKTSTGLEANVAALLCYVGGWISGLVFLLLETENRFVRFHAIQSIAVFGVFSVVLIVLKNILGMIPAIGWVFSDIFGNIVMAIAIIFWIILMLMAYQGRKHKLPWAGDIAARKSGLD
jgi:uncharacterized membrane protein